MLTRFSSNQCMIANAGLKTEITTDPVGVGEENLGAGILTVHTLVGTNLTFEIFIEASNDGSYWSTPAAPIYVTVALPAGPVEIPFTASAAFSRVRYVLTGGSDQAYVFFDFNVRYSQQ